MTFYDREAETLPREKIESLQRDKLRRLMATLETNGFYREKLARSGKKPSDVRAVDDLPFTTKTELVEEQSRFPPHGRLPSFPPERYRRLHRTSGTSGRPLVWLDTHEDWQAWIRCWGYVYRGAGVSPDDIVFLAFSFGPYVSHWSAIDGAAGIGALVVSGGGQSSLARLEAILEHRATVVLCTPTYALHLAEVAEENGLDLSASTVTTTIHAGEPGASVPNVRQRIERAWGARAFDHAGATEVGAWGFDCLERDHAIHLNEIEFIFEVLEPGGDRSVEDGERGELVITNLGRHGMPVVRYRTGDLVVRTRDTCPCGRTLARIEGGVLGRADDMLIVRGVNLYPAAIDDLVRSSSRVVEYEVEIWKRAGMDELRIKLETAEASDFGEVAEELHTRFRTQHNIRVELVQAPRGSLPRYELKARRYKRVER